MMFNAVMAAVNVAMYVGMGHHWYNAATATLCALVVLIDCVEGHR